MSSPEASPRGAQTRLAEAVGVSQPTVWKWINGQTRPDRDKWGVMETALGLQPGVLQAVGELDDRALQRPIPIDGRTIVVDFSEEVVGVVDAGETMEDLADPFRYGDFSSRGRSISDALDSALAIELERRIEDQDPTRRDRARMERRTPVTVS